MCGRNAAREKARHGKRTQRQFSNNCTNIHYLSPFLFGCCRVVSSTERHQICCSRAEPARNCEFGDELQADSTPSSLASVTDYSPAMLLSQLAKVLYQQGFPARLSPSSAGAPCFSRGSWTLVQRKKRSILKWALALGFLAAGAKAHDQSRDPSRSAEALLPPHKCGGSHPAELGPHPTHQRLRQPADGLTLSTPGSAEQEHRAAKKTRGGQIHPA